MEGGGVVDFLKDPIGNLKSLVVKKDETAGFDEISRKGREEEAERQRRIDRGEREETENTLNLPQSEPGISRKAALFLNGQYQTAKNEIKRLRHMMAKNEILVLGERVVMDEAGFDPNRYSDRVSFKQKYFYTLTDETELERKKDVFKKYFNEVSQLSMEDPRPPCALDEKQILLEGLYNRFNTLRTEIRIVSKKTPDSIDLRQRIDHVIRLKSFMEMLDSQPDCLSYDQNGQVNIINGDPSIRDDELELLLKRFAILVLQAKNPMRADTKVDPNFARALVAEVQKLSTLDDGSAAAYIQTRTDPANNLRTPEMFRQLLEGNPLVKAGSTEEELEKIKEALIDKVKGLDGWGAQDAILNQNDTQGTQDRKSKLIIYIGGVIAWIVEKYKECFESIKKNTEKLEGVKEKERTNTEKIASLEAAEAAAKAEVASGKAEAERTRADVAAQLAEAQQVAEALRAEKAQLTAKNEVLTREAKEYKDALLANSSKHDAEFSALQVEKEKIEADLAAKTASLQGIQAQLASNIGNTELTQKEKELQAIVNGLKKTAATRKSQLDEYQSKYAKQTNEMNRNKENYSLSKGTLEQQLLELRAALAGKGAEVAANTAAAEQNRARIAQLEANVRTAEAAGGETENLRREIAVLNERLKGLLAKSLEIEKQKGIVSRLERELTEARQAGDNKIPLDTLQAQIASIQAALGNPDGPPQELPGDIQEGPLANLYREINEFSNKQKASIDSAKGYQLCYLNFIVTYFLKRFLHDENSRASVQRLNSNLETIIGAIRVANERELFREGYGRTAETYKAILDILFPLLESTETLYLNGILGPSPEPVPEGYYVIRQYDHMGEDREKNRKKMEKLNDMLFKLYKFLKDNPGFGTPFETSLKSKFKTSKTHVGFRPPFVPEKPPQETYIYPFDESVGGYSVNTRNLFINPIVVYSTKENINDLNPDSFGDTFGLYKVPENEFQSRIGIDGQYKELLRGKALNIKQRVNEQEQRPLLSYEFLFTFFLLVARRYLREKGEDLKQQGCPLPSQLSNFEGQNPDKFGADAALDAAAVAPARPAAPPPPPPPAAPPAVPQQPQQQPQQQPPPAAPVVRISDLTPKDDKVSYFATKDHIKKIIDGILRQIGGTSSLLYINNLTSEIDSTYKNVGTKRASKFLAEKGFDSNFNKFIHKYKSVVNTPFKTSFTDPTPDTNDIRTFFKSFFKFISPIKLESQRNYDIEGKRKEIKIILKKFFERLLAVYIDTFPAINPDFTRDQLVDKLNTIRPIFKEILNDIVLDEDIQTTGERSLAKRTGTGTGAGVEYVFTGNPKLDSIVTLDSIKVDSDTKRLVVVIPKTGGGNEEVDLLNQLTS